MTEKNDFITFFEKSSTKKRTFKRELCSRYLTPLGVLWRKPLIGLKKESFALAEKGAGNYSLLGVDKVHEKNGLKKAIFDCVIYAVRRTVA